MVMPSRSSQQPTSSLDAADEIDVFAPVLTGPPPIAPSEVVVQPAAEPAAEPMTPPALSELPAEPLTTPAGPDGVPLTLDQVRTAFLLDCFQLLRGPEQMAELKRLLTSGTNRERREAFQMLLAALVPHTKPEDSSGSGRVQIQIVNAVPRPSGSPELHIEVPR